MKKESVLLAALLALFFLTSCASNGTVVPKAFPDANKMFSVNKGGTVEVVGADTKIAPTHWVFVRCNHWSGCYMRCQGPKKICKSIAIKSDLKVSYIQSNN